MTRIRALAQTSKVCAFTLTSNTLSARQFLPLLDNQALRKHLRWLRWDCPFPELMQRIGQLKLLDTLLLGSPIEKKSFALLSYASKLSTLKFHEHASDPCIWAAATLPALRHLHIVRPRSLCKHFLAFCKSAPALETMRLERWNDGIDADSLSGAVLREAFQSLRALRTLWLDGEFFFSSPWLVEVRHAPALTLLRVSVRCHIPSQELLDTLAAVPGLMCELTILQASSTVLINLARSQAKKLQATFSTPRVSAFIDPGDEGCALKSNQASA